MKQEHKTKKSGIGLLLAIAVFLVGFGGELKADALADLDAAWDAYVRNDYGQAITLYTRAIESGELTGRHLPDAYHNRGRSLHALGRYDEAIKDFDQIIELNPYFSEVYISRGRAHQALAHLKEAIGDFSRAIEFDPESTAGYSYRAAVFAEQGLYEKTIEDQSKIIDLTPDDPFGYAARCETYELISSIQKAAEDCNKALSLDPGNVGARATLERLGIAH